MKRPLSDRATILLALVVVGVMAWRASREGSIDWTLDQVGPTIRMVERNVEIADAAKAAKDGPWGFLSLPADPPEKARRRGVQVYYRAIDRLEELARPREARTLRAHLAFLLANLAEPWRAIASGRSSSGRRSPVDSARRCAPQPPILRAARFSLRARSSHCGRDGQQPSSRSSSWRPPETSSRPRVDVRWRTIRARSPAPLGGARARRRGTALRGCLVAGFRSALCGMATADCGDVAGRRLGVESRHRRLRTVGVRGPRSDGDLRVIRLRRAGVDRVPVGFSLLVSAASLAGAPPSGRRALAAHSAEGFRCCPQA